mgnify:CR=1 FL=1
MDRIDKTNYYLDIAETILERGTCLRKNYGCIIVKNDEIISTGYSGAPRNRKNCLDLGYCVKKKFYPDLRHGGYDACRSVHAEQNAILNALKNGYDLSDSTIYVTKSPCMICAKLIINVGIKRVIYANKYPDEEAFKILKEAEVKTQYFEIGKIKEVI